MCVFIGNTLFTNKYSPSDTILMQATKIYLSYTALLNQKKISGIFIIHIINIYFSFRAEADFKCYL